MRISRRSFVKGTASGLGAAAVLGNGLAVAQSPKNPLKFSFETAPPPIPASDIKETITSDIVVVGAGVSGLVAGLSAAESGAKVNQIEKAPMFSARGGDNTAINSRLHEKIGVQLDPSKIIHDLMRVQGGRLNQGVINLWAHNSGKVCNWIMDRWKRQGSRVTW